MSHYTLCTIFPPASEEVQNKFKKLYQENKDDLIDFFAGKLEKPLTKFSTDTEVEEHKIYIDDKELARMKDHYKEEDYLRSFEEYVKWKSLK